MILAAFFINSSFLPENITVIEDSKSSSSILMLFEVVSFNLDLDFTDISFLSNIIPITRTLFSAELIRDLACSIEIAPLQSGRLNNNLLNFLNLSLV